MSTIVNESAVPYTEALFRPQPSKADGMVHAAFAQANPNATASRPNWVAAPFQAKEEDQVPSEAGRIENATGSFGRSEPGGPYDTPIAPAARAWPLATGTPAPVEAPRATFECGDPGARSPSA